MDLSGLHRLCVMDKRGDYVLDKETATREIDSLEGVSSLDQILDRLRRWCMSMGIGKDGDSFSFQDIHQGVVFNGSATRFKDELSVLLVIPGKAKQRYRIPDLWSDFRWSVCYQEPLLADWRGYPSGEKWWGLASRDSCDEKEARERFKWLSSRRQINRVRLVHAGKVVEEYVAIRAGR